MSENSVRREGAEECRACSCHVAWSSTACTVLHLLRAASLLMLLLHACSRHSPDPPSRRSHTREEEDTSRHARTARSRDQVHAGQKGDRHSKSSFLVGGGS